MSEETCPLCPNGLFTATTQTINWIQCTICESWFHNSCLQLSLSDSKKISSFHCPNCSKLKGPSILRRVSSRTRHTIDYVALNDGDLESVILDQHPHVADFLQWENPKQEINEIKGVELQGKLTRPTKINSRDTKGLGMVIPDGITVDDVVESLGIDHPIEIMDVLTQNGIKGSWSLGSWRDYFKSNKTERERILNVLSLEISKSELGQSIKRPKYVEDVDLVDKVWPQELKMEKPMVQKYCLMGVEKSFTDFHLDFAGTSVYYTVLAGFKTFIFFPPTELNLKKYKTWIRSQTKQFLGNLGLEQGLKISLTKGDVLIIPSGWIHAVYTPVDTLVIGGNFLTSFNLKEQFKIIDIEIETKVDKKFKFPQFGKLMWFTSRAVLDGELELDDENLKELHNYLQKQCDLMKQGSKMERIIKDSVPYKYVGKPLDFLQKFQNFIEAQRSTTLKREHEDNEVMKTKKMKHE